MVESYKMPTEQQQWFKKEVFALLENLNKKNSSLALSTKELLDDIIIPKFIQQFGKPVYSKFPNRLKQSMLGILIHMPEVKKDGLTIEYTKAETLIEYLNDEKNITSIYTNVRWKLK